MNKILKCFTVVSILLLALPIVAGFSGGGNGTQESPYEITNWIELQEMNDYLNDEDVYFELQNDLDKDSGGYGHQVSGPEEGWKPIGDGTNEFTGSFDGQGYEISDLYINRSSEDHIGLFGYIGENGAIKNIGLENVDIYGNDETGSLLGYGYRVDIKNSFVKGGSVKGNHIVGGLIGEINSNSLLNNSYAELDSVTVESHRIGGLISTVYYSGAKVSNSYAVISEMTEDTGYGTQGALIGYLYQGTCEYSYANSDYTTLDLIGDNSGGTETGGGMKNTSEMQNINTYQPEWNITTTDDWDGETWHIDDGNDYPRLGEPLFAGGNGSLENPYEIENWHHLYNVREDLEAYYILKNNLNTTTEGYLDYNNPETEGWEPIGESGYEFTGEFDGDGYEISDLYIDRPNTDHIGLFGATENSTIENFGLLNTNITGDSYVGGIAGKQKSNVTESWEDPDYVPDIHNVQVKGQIKGKEYVGGIIGENYNASVMDSSVDVKITSEEEGYVGGIAGSNDISIINNVSAKGIVDTKGKRIGGISGKNDNSLINNTKVEMNVTGLEDGIGGITGYNNGGTVNSSRFTGTVKGLDHGSRDYYVGGIVGRNSNAAEILNSYSQGKVIQEGSDASSIGGIAGYNEEEGFPNSVIERSFSTADIHAINGTNIGGAVGQNRGNLRDVYARGEVKGNETIGGLIGYNRDGNVYDSYSTGKVIGNESTGGLIGDNIGYNESSFWDVETSEQNTSDGGTGLNTSEMQSFSTFDNAGWNITEVDYGETDTDYTWNIIQSPTYPFLSWQEPKEEPKPEEYEVLVNISGDGEGNVTAEWNDQEETVEDEKTLTINETTEVTLTAKPGEESEFDQWLKDCSEEETNTCTLNMTQNKTAKAIFLPETAEPTIVQPTPAAGLTVIMAIGLFVFALFFYLKTQQKS